MARRATSLGPKPSLSVLFGGVVLFSFFLSFFVSVFGGSKGQVRWPEGPPHLDLNHPSLFFFLLHFLLFVLFCVLEGQKTTFPLEKRLSPYF